MPDSIYLIVSSSTTAVGAGSLPPTRESAYLVELGEGETVDAAVRRFAQAAPADLLAADILVFDPADARRYRLNPGVELVETGS